MIPVLRTKGGRLSAAAILTVALAVPAVVLSTGSSAQSTRPSATLKAATQVGHVAAGKQVTLPSSSKPYTPTKAQLAAHQQALAGLATHKAPSIGNAVTKAQVSSNGGPQTNVPAKQAFLPGDLRIMRDSVVNSTCSGCGQSAVNEPSVANSGKDIVETSNWNIAYTVKGSAASIPWLNQNPYTLSSGFCCDQEIVYDPSRDEFILLQLDYTGEGAATNGFTVSLARGKTPTSWCTYKFSGAIGGGATDTPDYPKIALDNANAFISWNDYPPNASFARSGLARFPLDSLAACAGFSYNFVTRSTEFTFALSTSGQSLDTFYWVSNWFSDGTTNGSNLRIFSWADNSGSYTATTRAVNPFNFTMASCGTPNWCSRLDPRYESVVISRAEFRGQANAGFAGDTMLEVVGTAGPSGFSSGKNYTVYNYFKLNTLTYIGNDQTYSTGTNFAYAGCAVNVHGYVGCSMATGTNAPGGIVVLQDATSPTQPWAYNFTPGAVNGSSVGGDYIMTSAFYPNANVFQTVMWDINASNATEPHYIVFGRQRDYNGWIRFRAS